MAVTPDLYRLLEVQPRASVDVINAAYRAIMKTRHPDITASNGAPNSGKTVVLLNQAHDTLCDPVKRAQYDAERSAKASVGKIIGEYRVLKQIAEGGFGKTYTGEHILTGMPVCIKHCSEISPQYEEILIKETCAMWDLRHYAIPAARGLVRLDDGSLALVMSYIPGLTLEQVIEKAGKLDPEHVAWITERVLNAFMYIHQHGVLHGDVKPQNIIVQADRHMAVLVDFGLAMVKPSAMENSKGYTQYFAPPEQMKGLTLLPQSDYYSLGMTMIYALTGGMEKVARKQIPNDLPKPMEDFIRRLVSRDVMSRPEYGKEDLCDLIKEVRAASFKRKSSKMKPIPGI